MKKKSFVKIVLVVIIAFLPACWLLSIAKCKFNTYLHGAEFVGEHEQTNMISGNPEPKVLKYSDEVAEIYYVDDEGGDIITFEKIDGEWIMEDWRTVWSSSGGADGFMWPYGR